MHIHVHTDHFNGDFPGELGLAGCPLDFPSPYVPVLSQSQDPYLFISYHVFVRRPLCLVRSAFVIDI